MTQLNNDRVKILFRFFSNVLNKWTVETMWAQTIDKDKGLFKIDNIPFFVSVASGDTVLAGYDETEQMLTYKDSVEPSGNSIVQVVIMDKTIDLNDIRDTFKELGCDSEKYNEGYFVLEVPAAKGYEQIRQKLLDLKKIGSIDFCEPVLSDNHWY